MNATPYDPATKKNSGKEPRGTTNKNKTGHNVKRTDRQITKMINKLWHNAENGQANH
jgi:hypothetical protein